MKKFVAELNKIIISNSRLSLFILVSIVSIILLHLNTACYGFGISADSINYISIAKNISKDFSFLTSITEWNFNGTKYWNGYWPPLYPVLLVLPVLAGGAMAFTIFNGLLLGATFYLSFLLLQRIHHASNLVIYLTILLIVFSRWIIWIFCYLLSETVFIPLVLGYLLLLNNLIANRNDRNYLYVLVITCLLSLTRYIGIFFFLPIILFTLPSLYLFRLKRIIYLVIAIIPFSTILFINYFETSKIFGVRAKNNNSIFDLFATISEGINKWIFGNPNNTKLEAVITIGFILLVSFSLVLALRKGKGIIRIILVTASVYILAILSSALTERLEKFGFRFIAPIFIPVALVIVSAIMNFKKRIFYTTIILFLAISSFVIIRFVKSNQQFGIGTFATREWKFSKTIQYLRTGGIDKNIYSNYAEPINYYTGFPTKILTDEKEKIDEMLGKIKREHAMIVIINSNSRHQLETLELIQKEVEKQPRTTLADGVIYYF